MTLESHAANGSSQTVRSSLAAVSEWAYEIRYVWLSSPGMNSPSATLYDEYGNVLWTVAYGAGFTSYDTGWIAPTKVGKVYKIITGAAGNCGGSIWSLNIYAKYIGGEHTLYSTSGVSHFVASTTYPSYAATAAQRVVLSSYLRKDVVTSCRVQFVQTGGAGKNRAHTIYGLDKTTSIGSSSSASGFTSGFNDTINNTDGYVGRLRLYFEHYGWCGTITGTIYWYMTIAATEYLVGSTVINLAYPHAITIDIDPEYEHI